MRARVGLGVQRISIHALHEESDWIRRKRFFASASISIHALHEESDSACVWVLPPTCISIHALHEESDFFTIHAKFIGGISIHALHEESDQILIVNDNIRRFQSTLSMRRATFHSVDPFSRR